MAEVLAGGLGGVGTLRLGLMRSIEIIRRVMTPGGP